MSSRPANQSNYCLNTLTIDELKLVTETDKLTYQLV